MKSKLFNFLGLASLGFAIALGATSCDSEDEPVDDTPTNEPANGNTNNNENQNNNNSNVEQDNDARKAIYKLAQSSGFTGTYEEWLNSIKGAEVELSVVDDVLKWKYSNKTEWIPLMDMSTLKGLPGDDGQEIELRSSNGYVQWKYKDSTEWFNLYEINSEFKGEDGESAYEIYLKYHPGYEESEEQWISDYITGNLIKKVTFVRYANPNVEIEVEAGKTIDLTKVPDTSLLNYIFEGWYLDSEYKYPFNLNTDYIIEGITLYAKYTGISTPQIETEGIKEVQLNNAHHYVEAPEDVVYETDGGRLDVYVNYSGDSGITYREPAAFNNLVDNKNYTQGMLLPTWTTFAEKTKTTIVDASSYTTTSDRTTYELVKNNAYKSDTDSSQMIDLFYNTTTYIKTMGLAGEAVDLSLYLDQMPNFKAFLDDNPTIRKSIEEDGHIYYTPYFDGYNDTERMFIMDTALVQKVLDVDNFNSFDATINGGSNPASNVVQSASYTPYMHSTYNYPDSITNVKVLVGASTVEEISIRQTVNIINQQNQLLASGCTGKQLAEQFRDYLISAYGYYIGKDKIFKNYSDIFCSESAAYNADELIALMRVVKANPGVITGDSTSEVETFFPRGQHNIRVDNVADLMQIWGIQGLTSEKDMLYFDANGKLHDASTTLATYHALQKLSQIYDEGLIVDNFWYKPSSTDSNYYLNKYFKKNATESGYGLLMYDYAASQSTANDMVNGIGTNPANRKIEISQKGIKPILPPLTYWANTTGAQHDQSLTDFTGKTLMRYYEENRSLKSVSWCIPSSTDNLEGALRLMDYMFTEKGAMIQNFGPEAYWQKPNSLIGDTVEGTYDASKTYVATDLVEGELTPIISSTVKSMLSSNPMDIWSFMRAYIGNTQGIGSVRSKGLDVQTTNAYGQIGLVALKNAIKAGVVNQALVDKVKGTTTWDTTVPITGYPTIGTSSNYNYAALTSFWALDKCAATANGWVAVVAAKADADLSATELGTGGYTYAVVKNQITAKNEYYLKPYATALGETFIPDYLK